MSKTRLTVHDLLEFIAELSPETPIVLEHPETGAITSPTLTKSRRAGESVVEWLLIRALYDGEDENMSPSDDFARDERIGEFLAEA
jgi:hypothetical protein